MDGMMLRPFYSLFEEIPSPSDHVVFRFPHRPGSLAFLILAIASGGVAYGIHAFEGLARSHEVAFGGAVVFGAFSLFLLGRALQLIWTSRFLHLNLTARAATHLIRTPFRTVHQRHPFDGITCIQVTVHNTPSDEASNCSARICSTGLDPIQLGNAPQLKTMALARRISRLTGARLEVDDLRGGA